MTQLHSAEDAIKQAVEEAGYDSRHLRFCLPRVDAEVNEHCHAEIFHDPAFWQALSKARGWSKECSRCGIGNGMISFPECWTEKYGQYVSHDMQESWKLHALRYFETVLTAPEKIKEYWENLP